MLKYISIASLILFITCGTTTKYITVITEPPGALVEFNDNAIGYAPLTFPVEFRGGSCATGMGADALNTIRAIPSVNPTVREFVRKSLIDDKEPPDEFISGQRNILYKIDKMSNSEFNAMCRTFNQNLTRAQLISFIQQIISYASEVKMMLDYLEMTDGKGTMEDFERKYGSSSQYTQSKVMWNSEIIRQRNLTIYFDMSLRTAPKEYEFDFK